MRPGLRNLNSGAVNHSDINSFRRWAFESYGLSNVQIKPDPSNPTINIDTKIHLAAMRSQGGELAIEASTSPPAIDLIIYSRYVGPHGLDSGEMQANEIYSVWLIGKAPNEDGIISSLDGIASTEWNSPSIPASYTHRRLVGAFATKPALNQNAIIPFTQIGQTWLYHEPQELLNTTSSANIERTTGDLSNYVPEICEEVLLDCICSGGNAPITFKIYEHSTGEEIINLSPASGDFAHEVRWIYAPDRIIDYSLSVTNSATVVIRILGFILPIGQEF